MKYKFSILALLTAVLFAACDKKTNCPAFDDSVLKSWFPYETGVTYKFMNSDGRQEHFTITEEDYSEEHEIVNRFGGKKYYCDINGERKTLTNTVKQNEIPLRLHHVIEEDINKSYATGNRQGIHFTFRTMSKAILLSEDDSHLVLVSSNAQYKLDNFDVWEQNGRNYRNIADITILDEEATKIGMDKIYIASGAGIIGYRTYPEGKEYWQE